MAQQIAVSLARTNFDIHGKLVAISKQMDVGAPGAPGALTRAYRKEY